MDVKKKQQLFHCTGFSDWFL